MADSLLRLPSFHSLRLSSSSSSSYALVNLSNTQPFFHNCNSDRKIFSSSSSSSSSSSVGVGVSRFPISPRKQSVSFKVHAAVAETEPPKWWEKNAGPNMTDIHSTQEFLSALSQAGDRLVIVEFFGTWCASCRALFPKLCRTAAEHQEILFLKVNFDENKPMCKSLNVKVLPYFHFYRGSQGQLESFSCSLAKFQKIKDAIAMHNTPNSSPSQLAKGVGELTLESLLALKDKSG